MADGVDGIVVSEAGVQGTFWVRNGVVESLGWRSEEIRVYHVKVT